MTLIAAAVLIIVLIGVVLALKNRKTPVPQKDDTPAAPQVQKPEKELEEILKSLLDLNLLIRKDADFPAQLTREIEAVMDDLMIITPAMMDRYPGETLTYEIKKIGKEHLFKTVKTAASTSLICLNRPLTVSKRYPTDPAILLKKMRLRNLKPWPTFYLQNFNDPIFKFPLV